GRRQRDSLELEDLPVELCGAALQQLAYGPDRLANMREWLRLSHSERFERVRARTADRKPHPPAGELVDGRGHARHQDRVHEVDGRDGQTQLDPLGFAREDPEHRERLPLERIALGPDAVETVALRGSCVFELLLDRPVVFDADADL